MSNVAIGLVVTGGVFLGIAARIPIGIALVLGSLAGLTWLSGLKVALSLTTAVPFEFAGEWSLSAIPMFLLMGYVASNTGLANGLFEALRVSLRGVPGGMASSTVVASAVFASASGSSVATSAAMARIAVPGMLAAGYQRGLASGCVAAAGTLGSLIPPSVLMVLYGVFMQVSIGQLFIAGILPGLLTAGAYIAMITVRALHDPRLAPDHEMPSREEPGPRWRGLARVWPLPALIACVMGGIFLGWFSPTEAGAIGAAAAVLISLAAGAFSWSAFTSAVVQSARSTATIFFAAIGASLFARFIGLSGVPGFLRDTFIGATGGDPYLVVLLISCIFIVLGMFIESIALMLLVLPVIQPLLAEFGFDYIWFGIIVIKLLEIGLMTPPVGLNVYVIKSSLGDSVNLSEIFRGVGWFIATDVVVLAILIFFPAISTFLPSQMQ